MPHKIRTHVYAPSGAVARHRPLRAPRAEVGDRAIPCHEVVELHCALLHAVDVRERQGAALLEAGEATVVTLGGEPAVGETTVDERRQPARAVADAGNAARVPSERVVMPATGVR